MTEETTPTALTPAGLTGESTGNAPAPPVTDAGPQPPGVDGGALARETAGGVAPLPAPAGPQRTLKLVLTLRPRRRDRSESARGGPVSPAEDTAVETGSPVYDATLAAGADGCDPQFRSVTATALAAVLDEVPALVADAETRWQSQPRYPRPPEQPKPAGSKAAAGGEQPMQTGRKARATSEPAPASADGAAPDRMTTAQPPKSARAGGQASGSVAGAERRRAARGTPPAAPRQISLFG